MILCIVDADRGRDTEVDGDVDCCGGSEKIPTTTRIQRREGEYDNENERQLMTTSPVVYFTVSVRTDPSRTFVAQQSCNCLCWCSCVVLCNAESVGILYSICLCNFPPRHSSRHFITH